MPITFDLVENEGILEFSTYDSKPIRDVLLGTSPVTSKEETEQQHTEMCHVKESCVNFTNLTTSGNTHACTYEWVHPLQHQMSQQERYEWEETCGFIPVALYYNDVWM